jgi:predicted dehydrogenase
MNTLELAIIGCGDIARYMALFARLNRKVRLTACCDTDPQRAAAFARRFGIPNAYQDFETLLAHEQPQSVYLAVPHDLHLPMARLAAAAGAAVFCEKPLAASLEQGLELAALAKQPGIKIAVNYQYRYDRAAFALAQAARSGDLGQLHYLRANVPWQRTATYFASSSAWHSSRQRSGGGTLLTQGSHFLDLMLWAAGGRPVSAWGQTAQRVFTDSEIEDLAIGVVELDNGTLVEICSSMIARPERAATIEVYGSRGTLRYRDGLLPRLQTIGVKIQRQKPPVGGLHALARSLEAFRQWVSGGQPYLSPAGSALLTLQVVQALYQAASSGKRAAIPPMEPSSSGET